MTAKAKRVVGSHIVVLAMSRSMPQGHSMVWIMGFQGTFVALVLQLVVVESNCGEASEASDHAVECCLSALHSKYWGVTMLTFRLKHYEPEGASSPDAERAADMHDAAQVSRQQS